MPDKTTDATGWLTIRVPPIDTSTLPGRPREGLKKPVSDVLRHLARALDDAEVETPDGDYAARKSWGVLPALSWLCQQIHDAAVAKTHRTGQEQDVADKPKATGDLGPVEWTTIEVPRVRRWAWPISRTKVILNGAPSNTLQDMGEALENAGDPNPPHERYWDAYDAAKWLLGKVAEVAVDGTPLEIEEGD